jgi:endonuclease/exonuclease/phosphatase family metal-dependent hydrolase
MTPHKGASLRLATYNVEWFTKLFDKKGRFLNNNAQSARYQTTKAQQFAAIGHVFQALDADGIMIIEAPDSSDHRSATTALENFAQYFSLRARRAVVGFVSDTKQEIAFLYDPDRLMAQHMPIGGKDRNAPAPRFDLELPYGTHSPKNIIRFSKPPLELTLNTLDGTALSVIGLHAKSKAVRHRNNQTAQLRHAIENRRQQLGECFWVRARVDQLLAQDRSVIVMGDLNDGPGLDEYEQIFGYSGVEVILGHDKSETHQLFDPHAIQDAALWGQLPAVSARFWLQDQQVYDAAMLDYILVSHNIRKTQPLWRIWHPLYDPVILQDTLLAQALLTASDHFPVSIDLSLPIAPLIA